MSGDVQGVGAGLAFAVQPSDPAVYEQRAEEPVRAAPSARLLQPQHGRPGKVCRAGEQSVCRNGDDVRLICERGTSVISVSFHVISLKMS